MALFENKGRSHFLFAILIERTKNVLLEKIIMETFLKLSFNLSGFIPKVINL